MKLTHLLVTATTAIFLSACSDSSNYNFDASTDDAVEDALVSTSATANFDPATGDIPFPNNLLFNGSQDGTLNIPLDNDVDPADISNPSVALNALDGFSTTQPFTLSFDKDIDPASLVLGESVHVFEVTTDAATTAVTGITSTLTQQDVALTVSGGNTLVILPVRPLKESTDYMVIVTPAVTNTVGRPSKASSSFLLARGGTPLTGAFAALEPVRQLTNAMLAAAAGEGIDTSSVIQAWTAKTQSIRPTLEAIKNQTVAGNIVVGPSGLNTSQVNPALPGIADIFVGTLDVPYYRTAPASANDPVGITSHWEGPGNSNLSRFNPMPTVTSTQTIPVLMTVPNANSGQTQPDTGWPVAIFIHGVTQNRTNLLAVADTMANAGFVVIGIDQPMHGITDTTSPLYASERTFDIDLVNNTTGAAGPDGEIDSTGTHFYSPLYLLASRDNLRQSAADLMVLSASLASIPGVTLDTANKTLIGHSLGGTVATTFLAFDDSINAATLGMPAASLAPMLIASPAFGPTLIAGLSAAGLEQGTADFDQFILAAQTVIDSGDAINHGAAAAANTAIHMIEVVGDGADSLPDQTVPNSVATAPLAGSHALARVMGFDPANPTSATIAGPGLVQFTAGEHGSLINPAANVAVTTEMQTQMATFAATGGTTLLITDTSVIKGAN